MPPAKRIFLIILICFSFWHSEISAVSSAGDLSIVVNRLQKKYGIDFVYRDIPLLQFKKEVIYEPIAFSDEAEFYQYLRLFEEQIDKYPRSFFSETQLETVVFVKKLFYDGKATEGFYNLPQKVIFFDFSRSSGFPQSQRHNIHHEIFHIIDTQMLYAFSEEWAGFNDPNFVYGRGEAQIRSGEADFLSSPHPGFATVYGLTSIEEDKAEIFACLMRKFPHRLLNKWIKNDQVLNRKIVLMKKIIVKYCAEMDDEFWRTLIN